jgi:hypothetical protein
MDKYSAFKDFAGPVATVIAALAAAYFAWQQSRTARRQADTAIDQLRFNLFQKRYEMYQRLRQTMWRVLDHDTPVTMVQDDYKFYSEAAFFFSPDIERWSRDVIIECQRVIQARKDGRTIDDQDYLAIREKLVKHIFYMSALFQPELGFQQLALRRHPSRLANRFIEAVVFLVNLERSLRRRWKILWEFLTQQ